MKLLYYKWDRQLRRIARWWLITVGRSKRKQLAPKHPHISSLCIPLSLSLISSHKHTHHNHLSVTFFLFLPFLFSWLLTKLDWIFSNRNMRLLPQTFTIDTYIISQQNDPLKVTIMNNKLIYLFIYSKCFILIRQDSGSESTPGTLSDLHHPQLIPACSKDNLNPSLHLPCPSTFYPHLSQCCPILAFHDTILIPFLHAPPPSSSHSCMS